MRTRLRSLLLTASALALGAGLLVAPSATAEPRQVQAKTVCPVGETRLVNGDFEEPVIPEKSYRLIKEADVPGWRTTDSKGDIEIWSTGFQNVPSKVGNQFAEINANSNGTLYQDLPTTPGQTLTWSLWHRARGAGSVGDTMYVRIGVPGAANPTSWTINDALPAGWVQHQGTYTVPAGQTTTRFGFAAGSTASGNPSIGNFIDDINFGTPACVEVTKSVSPEGTVPSDTVLTYRVAMENKGGSQVRTFELDDILTEGLVYIPDSMAIEINGSRIPVSDNPGGAGYYDAAKRTIVIDFERQSDPLGAGETATLEYKAKAFSKTAITIPNIAVAYYTDILDRRLEGWSNEVLTPVLPATDNGKVTGGELEVSTGYERPIDVDCLAIAVDSQGRALSVDKTSKPQNGTVTIKNGKPVYTPNKGFTGRDSFTCTIVNTDGQTGKVVVDVIVREPKTPVVVDPDKNDVITPEDLGLPPGSVIEDIERNPNHGDAVVEDGNVVYTPEKDYIGPDDFVVLTRDPDDDRVEVLVELFVGKEQEAKKPLGLPKKLPIRGTTVLIDHKVKTNAGRTARVSVECTPIRRSAPKGDVRPCSVTRTGNSVAITTYGIPVKVTVVVSAARKKGYSPYLETKKYRVR